ncbi:MAG: hypothetical protein GXO75_01730, partial [Calditrichaeota bacterium]|nr:hypothetical protein [Calditrichota bacterium]
MMTRLSTPRLVVLALLTVSVLWAAGAWAATDNFERADGALGASWDANTDLVILNGNMHNQSSTTGWDSFLAVYNVSNPNQATILWPANG